VAALGPLGSISPPPLVLRPVQRDGSKVHDPRLRYRLAWIEHSII
jgi:hypothetical protein